MGEVAALYVEKDGCYFGLPGVDPWDEARDARLYDGPWPVVSHTPCPRWGPMWFGQPLTVKKTGVRKKLGEVGARGGGTDSAPRIGTPEPFRDLLLSIARTAQHQEAA